MASLDYIKNLPFNIDANTAGIIPSVFAESMYLIDGKPFRLKGRKYLRAIYDTDIEEGLIKSGRQVEKSTTLSVKIGNSVILQPHTPVLYVAPRTEQVKMFSKTRLSKLFRYSQGNFIFRNLMHPDLANQVYMKEFTNGSEVYMRHCFDEGDNIRGLTIKELNLDEIQDIHVDAIPVIKETQSHFTEEGNRAITWYTGTPKTFSNTIEQLWQESTKNEWVIKCSHCGYRQILGIPNIEPTRMVCRKCKRELLKDDIADGDWVEMQSGKLIKGFRISQLMVPWIKIDGNGGIWDKYNKYSPAKFHNEVLGLSYEVADKPFYDKLLNDITDWDMDFVYRAEGKFALADIFMGVDWGSGERSYTVVTVGTMTDEKPARFRLLYTKKYTTSQEIDVEYQVRDIAKMMSDFRVKLCCVDWGFGFAQIQQLKKTFGNRVVPIYYSHSQKDLYKWDNQSERYVVKRTNVLHDYVTLVHNHGVVWPGRPIAEMRFLWDHHLAVQAEYRAGQLGRSEEMIYTHPIAHPDDGFHSCSYAYLAHRLSKGQHTKMKGSIEFYSVRSR